MYMYMYVDKLSCLTTSVRAFITAIRTIDEEVAIATDTSLSPVSTPVIVEGGNPLTEVRQRQFYATVITTSKVPFTSIL